MRAESGKPRVIDIESDEANFKSESWSEGGMASQVFVTPSVTTGQGTRRLIDLAGQGMAEFAGIKHNATAQVQLFHQNLMNLKLHMAVKCIKSKDAEAGTIDVEETRRRAEETLRPFEDHLALHGEILELADGLLASCAQLEKLGRGLLEEQAKGAGMLTTEEGVKKLTVRIKCLDNVWADVTSGWVKIKARMEFADATQEQMAQRSVPTFQVVEVAKEEDEADVVGWLAGVEGGPGLEDPVGHDEHEATT